MPKFEIGVCERHRQWIEVEADTLEDAVEKVADGEGEPTNFEFVEIMNVCTWQAYDLDGNFYDRLELKPYQ